VLCGVLAVWRRRWWGWCMDSYALITLAALALGLPHVAFFSSSCPIILLVLRCSCIYYTCIFLLVAMLYIGPIEIAYCV